MPQIVWTVTAKGHLRDQLDYIAQEDPEAAARVSERLYRSIKLLEIFPYHGTQPVGKRWRKLTVPRLPYTVFYLLDLPKIVILAIRHDKQKPL